MTCFETYLVCFQTASYLSGNEPENTELARLADSMNPYVYGGEESKDIYVYQRWASLWQSKGTFYTPSDDDHGYTFATKFFGWLPQSDSRFQAGKEAFEHLDRNLWYYFVNWNAISGTFLLLYHILKKHAADNEEAQAYLERMDPFNPAEESLSHDPEIWNEFSQLVQTLPPIYDISYDLARRFCQTKAPGCVLTLFRQIDFREWTKEELQTADYRMQTE